MILGIVQDIIDVPVLFFGWFCLTEGTPLFTTLIQKSYVIFNDHQQYPIQTQFSTFTVPIFTNLQPLPTFTDLYPSFGAAIFPSGQVRQALLDELRYCAEALRPFLTQRDNRPRERDNR